MGNHPASIATYADLLEAIDRSGFEVKTICYIHRQYFSEMGILIKINEHKLQVYVYPDEESRKSDMAQAIQARRFFYKDRSPEDEIHCWSFGHLNILYKGSDRGFIRKLVEVLGSPFLGIRRGHPEVKMERPSHVQRLI